MGDAPRADRLHRAARALAAAAVIGVLAACTPDEPVDPGTTTSTSSSTESSDPTTDPTTADDAPTPPQVDPPEAPEEMLVDDRAGAAAAAEYFLLVVDYARATGDSRLLEAMSGSSCQYCDSMLESVASLVEDGAWLETEPLTFEDVRVQFPAGADPNYVVRLIVHAPEATVRSADGVVEDWEAETFPRFAVLVEWAGDRFLVNGVDSDTET